MQSQKDYLALEEFCRRQGADLFGVADVTGIREEFALAAKVRDELSRAVCLGVRLSSAVLGEISAAPTRLYFHHYRTLNVFLDQLALRLSNYIQGKGYLALPIPASQILDWQNQRSHLSHKKIGALAGLGWLGRNNLLVNKKFGSQFRLCTVLTDMPLPTGEPLKENCGSCHCCIAACPAGAIKEDPACFGHQQCFEKLKEFQKARLVDQYVCGVCVNVCRGGGVNPVTPRKPQPSGWG
ncbi:MAG: hypothetical protein Q8N85_05895 [Candidatus Omnitrophota bacterium]|nr:hypothetical protein [Candidatus Omnitrophota bacterium]